MLQGYVGVLLDPCTTDDRFYSYSIASDIPGTSFWDVRV